MHDMLKFGGGNSAKPVASLFYDVAEGAEGPLRKHQTLVEFLNALARSDERLLLSSAMRLASHEFRHFGDWKWPEESMLSDMADDLSLSFSGSRFDGLELVAPTVLSQPAARAFPHIHSHADSPLAD